MFDRILVPTDLTERTNKALDLALRLAEPGPSRVTLLHVIQTIQGLESGELKEFYERLEHKARATMTALSHRSPGTGITVISEVVYGARAEEIVRFAAGHNVDLIVLPSHRVNPSIVDRDWGTISYQVGILAQCPVLLVK